MEKKSQTIFNINNLFAEYIVRKFDDDCLSQVEVVDFQNFLVIKGKTNSKEILELSKMKSELVDSFSGTENEFSIGNTIDLIDYDAKISSPKKMSFDFYNNTNPSKEKCETKKISLISKSDFPYGYSFDMGKSRYYYAKKIAYNLQAKYQWDKITIDLPEPFNENDFNIFVDNCNTPDESIKSAILDAFDFNYIGLMKKLEKSEWSKPLFNIDYEFEILKELNKNLILI